MYAQVTIFFLIFINAGNTACYKNLQLTFASAWEVRQQTYLIVNRVFYARIEYKQSDKLMKKYDLHAT